MIELGCSIILYLAVWEGLEEVGVGWWVEIGSHYVVLAGQELSMYTRLV